MYHQNIMSRTTLDIDRSILDEIRRIQRKERRSLGRIVSQLLADALSRRREQKGNADFTWISHPMKAMIDWNDKDALYAALEKDGP